MSHNQFLFLVLFVSDFNISTTKRPSNFFPYGELEVITFGNGKSLKVGILSDSQLNPSKRESDLTFTEHLERSFNCLKEQNIDVLIFA